MALYLFLHLWYETFVILFQPENGQSCIFFPLSPVNIKMCSSEENLWLLIHFIFFSVSCCCLNFNEDLS